VSKSLLLTAVAVVLAVAIARGQESQAANELLWEAARGGDTARIVAALGQGADVNAKSRYDVTALIFAAGSGRLEAVKLLVARGANVNALDTFYRSSAAGMALSQGHTDVVLVLLQNGSDADPLLATGVVVNNEAVVKAALAGRVTRQGLQTAVGLAEKTKRAAFAALIKGALDRLPADAAANATPPAPAAPAPTPTPTIATPAPAPPVARPPITRSTGPRHWPAFRGDRSAGNGDGQRAVTEWDVASGRNIKWKTPIPGIATSSPIVWGNRIFATTAIGKSGDNTFRTGLYGDVKPVDDLSPHEWKIYSLDKATGKILWERTAFAGVPNTKRHTKSSQASSTPATDGRHVVAVFGSAGLLVAWDFNGNELWRVNLGTLDNGWFFDPSFQWGHSSSPIIHRNSVIVQADVQKGSYIAAWDLDTGKALWRTARTDEISTWGTPTIASTTDGRDVLVTNGTKVRGYDPSTGALLWTLGPNSEITVGTPVASNGLVYVTGGYPPVRPIYAIRPGAKGDISLSKGQESSAAIAWSNMTEGTYIPTPIVYDGYLFTLNLNGIVNAYDPQNGQRAFRGRVGTGAFSASPVGADGRLYIASEDGEVYVLEAAEGLTQIARNDMKEVIMATPAISDGLIVVRTLGHLYGIGQ
jgi:outer membrane protein assembly factor BamB